MSVYQNIISKTSIDKGWSGDQKYCAVTADGVKYLLRISAIDRLERNQCASSTLYPQLSNSLSFPCR